MEPILNQLTKTLRSLFSNKINNIIHKKSGLNSKDIFNMVNMVNMDLTYASHLKDYGRLKVHQTHLTQKIPNAVIARLRRSNLGWSAKRGPRTTYQIYIYIYIFNDIFHKHIKFIGGPGYVLRTSTEFAST